MPREPRHNATLRSFENENQFFFVLFIGAGLMLISPKLNTPRGIRNNNPANLKKNGVDWLGLSEKQTDSTFYQFKEPKFGIRAAARVLKTYETHHYINTVRGIINRWAPTNENNTESYINHVASVLGVQPDQEISVNSYLVPLTEAIILHENGVQPYTMAQIVEGVSLA